MDAWGIIYIRQKSEVSKGIETAVFSANLQPNMKAEINL